jgi:hypothetical protein
MDGVLHGSRGIIEIPDGLPAPVTERFDILVDLSAASANAAAAAGAAANLANEDLQGAKREHALAQSRNDAAPPKAPLIDLAPLEKAKAAADKRAATANAALTIADQVKRGDDEAFTGALQFVNAARKTSGGNPMGSAAFTSRGYPDKTSAFGVSPVEPPRLKGNPSAILDTQSPLIKRLQGDITMNEQALTTKDGARADVHAIVARAAARATISVRPGTAKSPTSVVWPMITMPAFTSANGEYLRIPDVEALLARLAPDALAEALEDAVEQAYASEPLALSAAERRSTLAKLKAELLAAERLEVEAILALRKGGATGIAFRPDTNPKAILSVA